jgi:nitrite reductase/ring-hydroxylating ferredoxin subunit/uncharacterized membrane protein
MAVSTVENVTESINRAVDSQQSWLDPLAEALQGALTAAIDAGGEVARSVKTFFNGSWLGHPLHPAISDLPVGAWTTGLIMDLIGAEGAADACVKIGVVAAVPTALAGVADWHDTVDRDRRVGLAHALLNSAALGLFVGSIVARRRGSRALGVGLSTIGWATAFGSAYLGGDLVFKHGMNVNRTAWDPAGERFQRVARLDDLPIGRLSGGEIEVDGRKLPVVLLRDTGQVYALHGRCAHAGGPLAEGELVDGHCVVCPWHGSTFDMHDGSVRQGPSAYPQPRFETRVRDGDVEVRLVK